MFHTGLWNFAKNLIKNQEESEEIVSDTFIKLFNRNTSFDTLENIKAFLYISTRNACLNWIKANKTRQNLGTVISISQSEYTFNTAELIPDNPDLYHLEMELIVKLKEAVEALPDKCRKIFKMHIYEGKRVTDIALELGIKKGTVSTQIEIAKMKLKALIMFYSFFLLIKSIISAFIK
jgi:RNA polymerase sigma-70 factor (family 1)